MFLRIRKSKAQSITEYAIACAAVISGVMAMQAYVKRGVEGRLKSAIDVLKVNNVVDNVSVTNVNE